MKTKHIVALILIFLISIFLIQNAENVIVKYLVWEFSISLSLLFIISTSIGFLLYWLIRMKEKVQNYISNKKNIK